LVQQTSHVEVKQHSSAVSCHGYVLRLYIAVNDVFVVDVAQRGQDVTADTGRFVFRKGPSLSNELKHIIPAIVRHDQR
jgi:hypothetical protein